MTAIPKKASFKEKEKHGWEIIKTKTGTS